MADDSALPASKRTRTTSDRSRQIKTVGFLGISDYGFGQLECLASRYHVAFATAKQKAPAHASGLDLRLAEFCKERDIPYLGSVDANSQQLVALASKVDLVVIGGYDGILKKPFLEAPKHGVINTHLGMLPLNRGCFPTLWAQLHELRQGYTTYLVGTEIDFGPVLELYEAPESLGGITDTNRSVYDALAEAATARFSSSLERFEKGDDLAPCDGQQAYHKKGLPNNGWISWFWTNAFLRRFSLALDFAPYLPGRVRLQDGGLEVSVSIEATEKSEVAAAGVCPGTVLELLCETSGAEEFTVKTREGVARCRLRAGQVPTQGSVLTSGRPLAEPGTTEEACAHPVDLEFHGETLPLDRYSRATR